MKNRLKKLVVIGLVSVLALGAFSACGQPNNEQDAVDTPNVEDEADDEDSGDEEVAVEPEETPTEQVLNIAVFEGGFGRTYWDDIVGQFEAANPGVTVNMEISPDIGDILATQIAVGEWPDLMALPFTERSGVTASMIVNNEILDITDIFDEDVIDRPGTKLRDIIVAGVLESSLSSPYGDGRVHLAPFNVGPMGMVYNRNLFQEKGWATPQTWDEFFALGDSLVDAENHIDIGGTDVERALFTYQGIYAGYLESVLWSAVAGAGGIEAINAIEQYQEGSFDNDVVRSVLQEFAKLGTANYLMEGTIALNHTQSQTDMMMGRALFIPNGTWMEGEMEDAPREEGFEFGMMPSPVLSATDGRFVMSSFEPVFIPLRAENPDLAKEFIRFMYSEASVKSFAEHANGTIPVKDAIDIAGHLLTPGVASMFDVYELGQFMLVSFDTLPANTRVNIQAVIFDDNIGPMIMGHISVDEYIRIVEEAFAEIRSDMEE